MREKDCKPWGSARCYHLEQRISDSGIRRTYNYCALHKKPIRKVYSCMVVKERKRRW